MIGSDVLNLKKIINRYCIQEFFISIFFLCVIGIYYSDKHSFNMYEIVIFFVFLLYRINKHINLLIKTKKIKKIISSNKEFFDKELNNIIIHTKENFIFTENYVFFLSRNLHICTYNQLLLMYKTVKCQKGFGYIGYLVIVTKFGKYDIVLYHPQSNLSNIGIEDEIEKVLLLKNPNILIGKTRDNIKVLREKYNIKKF